MWRVRPMWPRERASGHPFPGRPPEGPSQPGGQGPGVQPPSTASGLLAPGGGGVASAPAVPSASSQPTEGPLFWLPAKPAGRLGTGPTALTLSRGLQPSGSAILGWLRGPWHTGSAQETVSQHSCQREGVSPGPIPRVGSGGLTLSILGSWCHWALNSDHPTDPHFTDG